MGLQTRVDSFTVPASTGNKAVTGVGFQPKAVIFWGNRRSADGGSGSASSNDDMPPWWGMAVSSSGRVTIGDDENLTSGAVFTDATKCLTSKSAGTVNFAADFVTMDSDGFTVNFSTANATAYIINFMALGGSDLTNASIVSFAAATATGNQAVTGAGFKPDCLIDMFTDNFGGSFGGYQFGFAVSTTQRAGTGASFDATHASRYQRINTFLGFGKGLTGGPAYREADLVTLDSDGFTVNWTTAAASPPTIYVLCLKGGRYAVGSFSQKTATGSQATTGIGFTPTGLLLGSIGNGATTTTIAPPGLEIMTGAASDSTHRAVTTMIDGTNGVAKLDRANVYVNMADNATPTVVSAADLTSFDADGFTLNYGSADGTPREVIFLAFGSATVVVGMEWMQVRAQPTSHHQRDIVTVH